MCAPIAIPLAAIAAGAGANYIGQSQSNAAMEAAAQQSMAQQRMLQAKQLQYQGQQDEAHKNARAIFNNQTMDAINADTVQGKEAAQQQRLSGILGDATTAAASNADPTRAPDAVSTVGAPTSGGSGSAGSRAYDSSLAANIARAIAFNTQQSGALSNITGRQFAAADQQRALERSGQGIGAENGRIAGLASLIAGNGNVMDAEAQAGQAAVQAAAGAGSGWKMAGQILPLVGSVASLGMGALGGGAAAANTYVNSASRVIGNGAKVAGFIT